MYLESGKAYFGVWVPNDWPTALQIRVVRSVRFQLRESEAYGMSPCADDCAAGQEAESDSGAQELPDEPVRANDVAQDKRDPQPASTWRSPSCLV
jgi:hypothetical protein